MPQSRSGVDEEAGNNMGQISQKQVPTLERKGLADGKADFGTPLLVRRSYVQIDVCSIGTYQYMCAECLPPNVIR